ncbi:MAG: kinase, partial [Rhodospirillales bacterium]|nr:kinase [Rhodospirillales bacterium]
MIISKTPFRMSLFGGGTDYPDWYRIHGGAVIGTTIDKYCYLSVRHLPPFFEHKHRVVWSNIELINEISDIRHPAVRAILEEMAFEDGMEITYNADLPARSGLGSSSSFSVGLLNALHALKGRMISKQALAREAIRIEQEVMGEAVGSQDQIWAAFGGLNRIEFHRDGGFDVSPLILSPDNRHALQSSLMLFFTGFSRYASEIAQKQIDNFGNKKNELGALGRLADEATGILQGTGDLVTDLGALMHQAWKLKRELADGVTTPAVDDIYSAGREAGALGGKLLGAGGGGFMLFVVRPEDRSKVRDRLKDLIHVSFEFDMG